jgi:putative transposase
MGVLSAHGCTQTRRNHSPAFKAKVALAAIKSERTIAQLADQFDIHVSQITAWKDQLQAGAVDVFATFGNGKSPTPEVDIKSLHAKIGELTLFRKCAQQGGFAERKTMIDREHDLPLTKQAKTLNISRRSLYYVPELVRPADLALMGQMDELHLDFPFAGSRMLRDLLAADGSKLGRRHVTTLMRKMGIEAAYRRPNTSKPAPGHKIFPYLLRGLTIDRPNQVWSTDITYIPMARGFVYLCAVMDWFARRILAWGLRLSPFLIRTGESLGARRSRHASSAEFGVESAARRRSRNELLPVQSSMPASWRMSRRVAARRRTRRREPPPDLHHFAKARMEPVGDTGFSRLFVGSMSPFRATAARPGYQPFSRSLVA